MYTNIRYIDLTVCLNNKN